MYNLWLSMLRRCYHEGALKNDPTYRGCEVCTEWKTLSLFALDLPKIVNYDLWVNNSNSRVTLDKDVLGNGRIYDLKSCSFMTSSDSSREVVLRYAGTNEGIHSLRPILSVVIMSHG